MNDQTSSENVTSDNRLFSTGSVLDNKWVFIERIGKGGMGEVFRAHQLNLKRDVAIKVISEEILEESEESPEDLASAMERLQIEVQTMAQVRHPYVLQIYDYGSVNVPHRGRPKQVQYIAMEYVPGNTFRYTMSEEGFGDETELLVEWLQTYFFPVLEGLGAIHSHGIVHRDIKPENILMDGDTPKITDFGLAKSPKVKAVSNSWDVKGTMPYMAPEQFVDFRKARFPADIYALGKILYEAISGKLDSKMVPFKSVALENPDTEFMAALDAIIRKATSENPQQRHQTVAELHKELISAIQRPAGQTESPTGIQKKPHPHLFWIWIGIAAVLLAVFTMAVYHVLEGPSKEPIITPRQADEQQAARTQKQPEKLSPTWIAEDGREMELINGPGRDQSFYSDPAPVTYHHYAEFLNEIQDTVEVTDGIVRSGEEIWIYLGDGSAPSDQILYRHSRFHLRSAEAAPKPVVRVTWLGADAYARHYGKQLPTLDQWRLLYPELSPPSAPMQPPQPDSGMAHHMETGPSPGQDDPVQHEHPATDLREWLAKGTQDPAVSRVAEWPVGDSQPEIRTQYLWEGFYDVGFRTVKAIH